MSDKENITPIITQRPEKGFNDSNVSNESETVNKFMHDIDNQISHDLEKRLNNITNLNEPLQSSNSMKLINEITNDLISSPDFDESDLDDPNEIVNVKERYISDSEESEYSLFNSRYRRKSSFESQEDEFKYAQLTSGRLSINNPYMNQVNNIAPEIVSSEADKSLDSENLLGFSPVNDIIVIDEIEEDLEIEKSFHDAVNSIDESSNLSLNIPPSDGYYLEPQFTTEKLSSSSMPSSLDDSYHSKLIHTQLLTGDATNHGLDILDDEDDSFINDAGNPPSSSLSTPLQSDNSINYNHDVNKFGSLQTSNVAKSSPLVTQEPLVYNSEEELSDLHSSSFNTSSVVYDIPFVNSSKATVPLPKLENIDEDGSLDTSDNSTVDEDHLEMSMTFPNEENPINPIKIISDDESPTASIHLDDLADGSLMTEQLKENILNSPKSPILMSEDVLSSDEQTYEFSTASPITVYETNVNTELHDTILEEHSYDENLKYSSELETIEEQPEEAHTVSTVSFDSAHDPIPIKETQYDESEINGHGVERESLCSSSSTTVDISSDDNLFDNVFKTASNKSSDTISSISSNELTSTVEQMRNISSSELSIISEHSEDDHGINLDKNDKGSKNSSKDLLNRLIRPEFMNDEISEDQKVVNEHLLLSYVYESATLKSMLDSKQHEMEYLQWCYDNMWIEAHNQAAITDTHISMVPHATQVLATPIDSIMPDMILQNDGSMIINQNSFLEQIPTMDVQPSMIEARENFDSSIVSPIAMNSTQGIEYQFNTDAIISKTDNEDVDDSIQNQDLDEILKLRSIAARIETASEFLSETLFGSDISLNTKLSILPAKIALLNNSLNITNSTLDEEGNKRDIIIGASPLSSIADNRVNSFSAMDTMRESKTDVFIKDESLETTPSNLNENAIVMDSSFMNSDGYLNKQVLEKEPIVTAEYVAITLQGNKSAMDMVKIIQDKLKMFVETNKEKDEMIEKLNEQMGALMDVQTNLINERAKKIDAMEHLQEELYNKQTLIDSYKECLKGMSTPLIERATIPFDEALSETIKKNEKEKEMVKKSALITPASSSVNSDAESDESDYVASSKEELIFEKNVLNSQFNASIIPHSDNRSFTTSSIVTGINGAPDEGNEDFELEHDSKSLDEKTSISGSSGNSTKKVRWAPVIKAISPSDLTKNLSLNSKHEEIETVTSPNVYYVETAFCELVNELAGEQPSLNDWVLNKYSLELAIQRVSEELKCLGELYLERDMVYGFSMNSQTSISNDSIQEKITGFNSVKSMLNELNERYEEEGDVLTLDDLKIMELMTESLNKFATDCDEHKITMDYTWLDDVLCRFDSCCGNNLPPFIDPVDNFNNDNIVLRTLVQSPENMEDLDEFPGLNNLADRFLVTPIVTRAGLLDDEKSSGDIQESHLIDGPESSIGNHNVSHILHENNENPSPGGFSFSVAQGIVNDDTLEDDAIKDSIDPYNRIEIYLQDLKSISPNNSIAIDGYKDPITIMGAIIKEYKLLLENKSGSSENNELADKLKETEEKVKVLEGRLRAREEYHMSAVMDSAKHSQELEANLNECKVKLETFAYELRVQKRMRRLLEKELLTLEESIGFSNESNSSLNLNNV